LNIPDEDVGSAIACMENAIIGRFSGFRPNIDVVRKWVHKRWCDPGQIQVATMINGFFSFFLSIS